MIPTLGGVAPPLGTALEEVARLTMPGSKDGSRCFLAGDPGGGLGETAEVVSAHFHSGREPRFRRAWACQRRENHGKGPGSDFRRPGSRCAGLGAGGNVTGGGPNLTHCLSMARSTLRSRALSVMNETQHSPSLETGAFRSRALDRLPVPRERSASVPVNSSRPRSPR